MGRAQRTVAKRLAHELDVRESVGLAAREADRLLELGDAQHLLESRDGAAQFCVEEVGERGDAQPGFDCEREWTGRNEV